MTIGDTWRRPDRPRRDGRHQPSPVSPGWTIPPRFRREPAGKAQLRADRRANHCGI